MRDPIEARKQGEKAKTRDRAPSYTGASKRKLMVERTSWGTDERGPGTGYDPGNEKADIIHGNPRDPLRMAGGKYWAYDEGANGTQSVNYLSKGTEANYAKMVPFHMLIDDPEIASNTDTWVGSPSDKNPFFKITQKVTVYPKKDFLSNLVGTGFYWYASPEGTGPHQSVAWRQFIGGSMKKLSPGASPWAQQNLSSPFPPHTEDYAGIVVTDKDFQYLAFNMNMPFDYKELAGLNITGPQYAKIRPEYNFYVRGYEQMLVAEPGATAPHSVLPNLYALMLEKINEKSNGTFANHLSLASTLSSGDSSVGASNKDKFNIKKHSGQYFDLYGRSFSGSYSGNRGSVITETAHQFRNIIVPIENIGLLKEISDKKELFPMFVEMEFSTDKTTTFAQALSDTKLTNDFLWSMVKNIINAPDTLEFQTSGGQQGKIGFAEVSEASHMNILEDGGTTITKSVGTKFLERKTWDVYAWLKSNSLIDFDSGAIKPPAFSGLEKEARENSVFLDDGTTEANQLVDEKKKFFKSLMGIVFIGKLKALLKDNFRTYEDIVNGKPCYTETVFYRIEKTLANDQGNPVGEVLQNFWFPNSNQIDILKFVDTQIKYGKSYAYRIYAYQFVVNTRYRYSNLEIQDDSATFDVHQTPQLLLVEVPIFTENHIIIDDPPVPPEVEIVPYFGNGHEILFNLKSAVGEYHLDPIALSGADFAAHEELRVAQKLGPGDPIRFKSDDPVGQEGFFEIYRAEEHPRSWSDFEGQLLVSIANNPSHGITETLTASSAEYVDKILSNKKYYYICRMIDTHGHVSNPSDVYEVELVNDEGSTYMIKRIVDFVLKEPKLPSKNMRRLIQIRPALEHTFIDENLFGNEASAFDIPSVKLGQKQEAPWGRKYKFRLISRKTGKKMDLNVDFSAILQRNTRRE